MSRSDDWRDGLAAVDDAPRMKDYMKPEDIDTEGAYALVAAIVRGASEEYIQRLRAMKRHPHDREVIFMYKRSRDFFLSDYFHKLTNLDGEAVLQQIIRRENERYERHHAKH